MTPRRTMLLAGAGAVVLGAGWWFGPGASSGGGPVTGALMFPGLSAALQGAARVEIANQARRLVITRVGAVWGLADRGGYPVQQDRLRELLTGLTELRLVEPRTADGTQYARLGVDDPLGPISTANLLRVLDGSGQVIAELIVGHRRVRTQGNTPETVYVRRPDAAQSWLAEGRLPADVDPQLWLERDITNIAAERIAGATATRGESVLVFGRVDGKMALTAPAEHPKLDDYRVEEVFRSLESLTLTDVKPVGEAPGAVVGRTVFGLVDGGSVTVESRVAEKDVWVVLSSSVADIQARVGRWAYQVGSWKEKAFLPTMDDLKAEEPEKKPE